MRRALRWLIEVLEDARWSLWAYRMGRKTGTSKRRARLDAKRVWNSRRYLRAHDARMVRQMAAAGVLR